MNFGLAKYETRFSCMYVIDNQAFLFSSNFQITMNTSNFIVHKKFTLVHTYQF